MSMIQGNLEVYGNLSAIPTLCLQGDIEEMPTSYNF